jgi:hypothetical protein
LIISSQIYSLDDGVPSCSKRGISRFKETPSQRIKKLSKISKLDRFPIFIRLLEKKVELKADTLETIDRNPSMTMQQLSHHIEVRIDVEEREIDGTKTSEEKEIIYHSNNAYEWIYSVVRTILLNWCHWCH